MDTSNLRPNQGGSANGGDSSMESGDWRSQLEADTRQMILNKMYVFMSFKLSLFCALKMDRLKRHLPYSGAEGIRELNRKAVRFEEKIYVNATSKFDYLRKIALNMLYLEYVSQNPMRDAIQSYSTANGVNPSGPGSNSMIRREMDTSNWRPSEGGSAGGGMQFYDWRSQLTPDSRQRIVNKITDTLKRHLRLSRDEELKELHAIAGRFEEKIYAAAASQFDYLRIISVKMMSMMKNRPQNPMPNAMQSYPTSNSLNPSDPGIS
ncbi:hypothetical protein OSB04_029959 [Centaurea solstitialis]|uniref:Mediator complex subunit 15 KIX domain-containing protein n=1 Tax=Centaurea solstitialis TaxID=347529 RepID=A0AA38SJP8_9ASTR|nr:hypothetical protein OSB04_029959 [Centaurea solstitialis]